MRKLTLIGKINIFKTLAISKIVYISYMSSVPEDVLSQLRHIHHDFIWDGKKAKIKHSTLIADYCEGGLRDIDIDIKIKALQLSWLRRLEDNNFHPWKIIPKHLLSIISSNGSSLFYPNMEFKENVQFKALPKFYQNIIHYWCEFSRGEPITPSMILSESMCHNRFLKIGNEVISCSFLNLDKPLFVADFFDLIGNLKTWPRFKSDLSIPNTMFFKWTQLVDAIPKQWQELLKSTEGGSRVLCEFRPHLISKAKLFPLEKTNIKRAL